MSWKDGGSDWSFIIRSLSNVTESLDREAFWFNSFNECKNFPLNTNKNPPLWFLVLPIFFIMPRASLELDSNDPTNVDVLVSELIRMISPPANKNIFPVVWATTTVVYCSYAVLARSLYFDNLRCWSTWRNWLILWKSCPSVRKSILTIPSPCLSNLQFSADFHDVMLSLNLLCCSSSNLVVLLS